MFNKEKSSEREIKKLNHLLLTHLEDALEIMTTTKCPYFKRVENKNIRCEGIDSTNNIVMSFSKYNRLYKYRYDFCDSRCWKGCPIAQVLEELYKE